MNRETKDERIIWIIRFCDGTLASMYGVKEDAKKLAEEKKDLYGGGYIII